MRIKRAAMALACLGLALATSVAAPKAASAEETSPVSITVKSVSATSIELGRTTEVQISGTITNTSGGRLSWVTAEFWRDQHPLTNQQQLDAVLKGPAPTSGGARLRDETAGNLAYITKEASFAKGQTAPFAIRASVSSLGISKEGAYQIGVQVRALTESGKVKTVGTDRWIVPAVSRIHPHAALVVLAAAPTMSHPGKFLDDSLTADLSGHLGDLITLAERTGSRFAIDPNLYEEVTALATNHTVADAPRPPDLRAAAFKDRLDRLIARGTGFRLPYGYPALDLAEKSGALGETIGQLSLVPTPQLAGLPLAVVCGNRMSREEINQIHPNVAFVENVSASGSGVIRTVPLAVSGNAKDSTSLWKKQQMRLAQEVVGSLAGEPVTRVISTAEDVRNENFEQPWRKLTDLPQTAAEPAWSESTPPNIQNTELTSELDEWTSRISLYRQLSSPAEALLEPTKLVLRARSTLLTPEAALKLLRAGPELAASPVQLRAQPSFVMTGRSNVFPLSVTNRSNLPIRVGMKFDSASPQRIDASDSPVLDIGPGETVGFDLNVTSTGNAVVPVEVWLSSEAGEQVSPKTTIVITSTDVGMLSLIIIIAAALLLVGGTSLRIRAVRRERAQQGSSK